MTDGRHGFPLTIPALLRSTTSNIPGHYCIQHHSTIPLAARTEIPPLVHVRTQALYADTQASL